MTDLSVYKNQDGTYTSPKNGKLYKSEKALRSHLSFRKTELFHNFKNLHNKKECVVCGESNIVEVHHLDENKTNNNPSNLIPLCPNHHQYWHSRYRHLVEEKIYSYIRDWKNKLSMA